MANKENVLVIGSDGFIGRNVKDVLSVNHKVYSANKSNSEQDNDYHIDLLDKATIAKVLWELRPQVIINCAGIVSNNEQATQNPTFTSNLLEEVQASGIKPKRIIISGSAAEYGIVDKNDIPVDEETPLRANSAYGLSKLQETSLALDFGLKHQMPVVIARIFNPIGLGMPSRLLIPRILEQIQEIREGKRESIEVSRLDSKRDYVDVRDVALAIQSIVDKSPKELIYNVGSGAATSNGQLIELILSNAGLSHRPPVKETAAEPEPLVAIQADVSRIKNELGWEPLNTLEKTIKEVVNAGK